MPYGYNGKILRVNLSTGKIKVEEPDELFYRTYMGGRAIAAYYLLKELKSGIDPLRRENKLIFATSVVTGAPFPGNSRFTVAAKSPMTGGYGESEAGGFWAAELKFSGYDAIIVEGRADKPVYLWIHDDKVEIRDASRCWGKTTGETDELVKEEVRDKRARVACIGPAAEKLVRFACIVNDVRHFSGRTGMGAVMGSKNLQAIAVRGKKKVEVKDFETVRREVRWFNENYKKNPCNSMLQDVGTSGIVGDMNALGILPTHNFREGYHEKAGEISGSTMRDTILIDREGCYACPVKCKRIVKVDSPYVVDPMYGGPEYETIGALGSNCGIFDIKAVAKANELCNKFGMDTITTGHVISFAMECFEKGLLTKEDTGGIELTFGNSAAQHKLIEMVARQEGLGKILAQGTKRAAKIIGKGSEKFAIQVKGNEAAAHEPRGKFGLGLMYAVSPIGADHMQAEHDHLFATEDIVSFQQVKALGLLEPMDLFDLGPKKVRMMVYLHIFESIYDVLDLCKFTGVPFRTWRTANYVRLVSAITGWETSLWELMKVGERALNMLRCFNIREGFGRKDDTLPERFFQPLEGGPLKGKAIPKKEFEEAITVFYSMMGWDPETGIPTKAKLKELNIEWVADTIEARERG